MEENWRGHRAWRKYVHEKAVEGISLEWESFSPPQVADVDNFAMTPALAVFYDSKPETMVRRDSMTSEKLTQLVAGLYESQGGDFKQGEWMRGECMSLSLWLTNHIAHSYPIRMSDESAKRYGIIQDAHDKEINANFSARINDYAQMSPEAQAHEILQFLEPLRPVWNELRIASQRPYCRYPVHYNHNPASSIARPHVTLILRLSSLLGLSAICHLYLEQTEAAMTDLELGFHLSDSLKTDPWPESYFTHCRIHHLLTQAIWEGAVENLWSATQLERLQKRLTPFDQIAEVRRILNKERIFFNRVIEENRMELKSAWAEWRHSEASLQLAAYILYFQCAPNGWMDWEKIHLNRVHDEFVPQVFNLSTGRVSTNSCARMRAWYDTPERRHPFWHHSFFKGCLSPQLEFMAKKVAKAQTTLDLAYLGCALERYRLANRELPASLSDLVPNYIKKMPLDVLTGEPYRYRLTNKNQYVLYSIGIDGKDDGATVRFNAKQKSSDEEGDWVWFGGSPPERPEGQPIKLQ